MRQIIDLYLNDYSREIIIPFSTRIPIDLELEDYESGPEIVLGVSNFPLFQHTTLELVNPKVTASIKLNLVSKALITKLDPNKINSMDLKPIKDLDIDRNEIYYNTN